MPARSASHHHPVASRAGPTRTRAIRAAMRLMFAALRGLADQVNRAPTPDAPHRQRELVALAGALVFLMGR